MSNEFRAKEQQQKQNISIISFRNYYFGYWKEIRDVY